SSIATGREEFWDALQAMRSGAKLVELDRFGTIGAFPAPADDGAEERFGRKNARRMDRAGRLAAVATALALDDAGDGGGSAERIGCAIGSAHGGADTMHEAYETFFERGADRMSPFSIPLGLPNTAASAVAREHGLHGPSASIGTACAAGSDAIGTAFRLIRDGHADAMAAGGAGAALTPVLVARYQKLGALSPALREPTVLSRPFDKGRDGFVMGEGAGILVLEDRERAEARGARILAEVAGFGQSCDAGHLTDPDETGAGPARAVRLALADAGLEP